MKVNKLVIELDDGSIKEFEPISEKDILLFMICKNEEDDKNPIIISQFTENPSINLDVMRNILMSPFLKKSNNEQSNDVKPVEE